MTREEIKQSIIERVKKLQNAKGGNARDEKYQMGNAAGMIIVYKQLGMIDEYDGMLVEIMDELF